MTTGACFGRVFLRIVEGLRTTRLMPGASRLSAIVSGRDGRSGVTPKRAPIPMLIGRASERPGPQAVVKHFLSVFRSGYCRPYAMALRPMYSDGELAGIRSLKNSPDGEGG